MKIFSFVTQYAIISALSLDIIIGVKPKIKLNDSHMTSVILSL